jgi:molybdopterin molybdotransferase
MIPFDEAKLIVLNDARPLGVEKLALHQADGRYLARSLNARLDMPRFDQSAMDGFAVKLVDLAGASAKHPVALTLDGDLPAGSTRRPRLRRGHTVKVFTGSTLPEGTEAVVMVEYSRTRGNTVYLKKEASAGDHIRRRGEEYSKGDLLMKTGSLVDPSVIGLLATFGYAEIPAFKLPSVTLLTLGDELIPLGVALKAGKIYNSNKFSLTAALKRIGVRKIRARIVPDDRAALRRAITRGLDESDVVLAAGGASVGDYDFVRPVTADVGIEERFRAVAVKPGKPVFFGTWKAPGRGGAAKLFFGVPGNPVSALVCLHQFVRPALRKMMGDPAQREQFLSAELAGECVKRPGRLHLTRGRLESRDGRLVVHPLSRQGSHMMGGMANADCLILFPSHQHKLSRGQTVQVVRIDW